MNNNCVNKLFSPAVGWTNDPNGLIVIDGTYHLFFQHYPEDIIWGPMHWGHAISKDGETWEELPIAIKPDKDGYIFSGSCILDEDNVSGLGTKTKPALLAFYTLHEPKSGCQQQCIAYSTDYLNFTKYSNNPVISNDPESADYRKDFRDPKVFPNPVSGGYSMALAAGEDILFYHSENLLSWTLTGRFCVGDILGPGICECPDCFWIDNDWVLSLSYIPNSVPEEQVTTFQDRHTMNYFFGCFDGNTFVRDEKESADLMWDHGPDHYAMVTFANTNMRLCMGWGENWDYVYDIPAQGHRGRMTHIRQIGLVRTEHGKRLSFCPIDSRKPATMVIQDRGIIEDGLGHKLLVTVTKDQIMIRRPPIEGTNSSRWLALPGYQTFQAKRLFSEPVTLSYYVSEGYFEIFTQRGCVVFSIRC